MRPIFTLHAGEFLVGQHVERVFKSYRVWAPTKDTGVDLLVTNKTNSKAASLQVKFSRDYLITHGNKSAGFQKSMRACGWFVLDRSKIEKSTADLWVMVLIGSKQRSQDFVIIRPSQLLRRLGQIHGRQNKYQTYLWVTDGKSPRCWEARGVAKNDQIKLSEGGFRNRARDFTAYLNNWRLLRERL